MTSCLFHYRSWNLLTFLLIVLLFSTVSFADPSSAPDSFHQEVQQAERLAVQQGDRCIVCGGLLEEGDPVFFLRGRRVPVKEDVLDEFMADPERYFSKIQPKAALFSESLVRGTPDYTWFYIGIFAVLSLLGGGLFSYLRMQDDEPLPEGHTKTLRTHQPVPCPHCGASVHPAAAVCPFCNGTLEPSMVSEVDKSKSAQC